MSLVSRLMALGDPRWHGNGFTQLDLNPRQRLHVWHPAWAQNPRHNSTIHDHVFDLTSEVLLGKVGHEAFEVIYGETLSGPIQVFRLQGWGSGPYTGAARAEHHEWRGRGTKKSLGSYLIPAGGQYSFPRYQFHESSHEGLTATLMTRSNGVSPDARPRIVCPVIEDPTDARESGHGPGVEAMWSIVEEAVDRMWTNSQARIEACIS